MQGDPGWRQRPLVPLHLCVEIMATVPPMPTRPFLWRATPDAREVYEIDLQGMRYRFVGDRQWHKTTTRSPQAWWRDFFAEGITGIIDWQDPVVLMDFPDAEEA